MNSQVSSMSYHSSLSLQLWTIFLHLPVATSALLSQASPPWPCLWEVGSCLALGVPTVGIRGTGDLLAKTGLNSLWLWLQLLGDKFQPQIETGTGGTVCPVHLQTCHPYHREAEAEIRAVRFESSQDSREPGIWQGLHEEGDRSRCCTPEWGMHPQPPAAAAPAHCYPPSKPL